MLHIKKRILAVLLAFVCAFTVLPITEPCEIYAASSESATTISFSAANEKTAKKVDALLQQKKAVKLVYKGKQKEAKKKVEKLEKQIQKVNKYGVRFQYSCKYAKGKTTITINKDNAKTYFYMLKYMKKIYKIVKSKDLISDCTRYPDYETLKMHLIYDYLFRNFQWYAEAGVSETVFTQNPNGGEYGWKIDSETGKQIIGWVGINGEFDGSEAVFTRTEIEDVTTTKSSSYLLEKVYDISTDTYEDDKYYETNREEYGQIIDKGLAWESAYVKTDVGYKGIITYTANYMTFDEFKEKFPTSNDFTSMYPDFRFGVSQTDWLIATNDFCDLSDAVKVYVIDKSGYFECLGKGYKMKYAFVYGYNLASRYWDLMSGTREFIAPEDVKSLADGTACGVCDGFACAECIVWSQLGITCTYACNYDINHAWTVVKVKNSNGKVLWIPFDYGIGPSQHLAVEANITKKYLQTEEMRYKIYLKDKDGNPVMDGAPSYKNFTEEDFI